VKPAVLVTDGEQRAALATVRSLGRAGYPVYVTSRRGHSLAGASRYARAEGLVPDALLEPAAFAETLRQLIARWRIGVLLPITEPSILASLGAPQGFDGVLLPLPSLDSFLRASDKALLMQLAPSVGLAVPAQGVLASADELGSLASELRYPVVLKPGRSVSEAGGSREKLGVSHAASPDQFASRVRALSPAAFPLLIQQRIVGPGVGIFLLRHAGKTYATFSHRRIREKPPSGGVSVYRESIAADPVLVARSSALLDTVDWEGVAMIEYKLDIETGTPYLMEINGRFWGSLQLAIDAGVDFPRLLIELAGGEVPTPVTRYRTGIRSRWWWGDVDHLIARLRKSSAELDLPSGSPGRLRALVDFLTLWRPGDRNEIFHLGDPGPFFRETLEWLNRR
jgi:predicted ATP-grasp superfamily ATP-dependent carboligase